MTQAAYLDLRHDVFRICTFVAANALLANFLPKSTMFKNHKELRYWYEVFVSLVAGFALNWRVCLPSLDAQFIGFQRTAKHAYRNWQQTRMDIELQQCEHED